jgi:hypothetical protein
MPAAIPVPLRQLLVERIARGEPIAAAAADLGLSFWTARTLWRRYRDRGMDGLAPDHAACGRPGRRGSPLIARAALLLRRRHPTWGAGAIRAILTARYPTEPVPHERTLRRWFAAAGLTRAVPRAPRPPAPPRATTPHDTWQLDAKEQIALASGARACWLVATDEASGACLDPVVFPLRSHVPRPADRGPGRPARALRRLGAAPLPARRQRDAVGELERPADRPRTVVGGA